MENKYFMHRIKEENGEFTKGIEVHDTLDAAILSYYSYGVYANNNPLYPNVTFVSRKITDMYGNVVGKYSNAWNRSYEDLASVYFMHYIRKDGDSFTKGIDACSTIEEARLSFDAQMAYGYGNTKFPNVSHVSCMIDSKYGTAEQQDVWNEPEPEPEPQPEPEE